MDMVAKPKRNGPVGSFFSFLHLSVCPDWERRKKTIKEGQKCPKFCFLPFHRSYTWLVARIKANFYCSWRGWKKIKQASFNQDHLNFPLSPQPRLHANCGNRKLNCSTTIVTHILGGFISFPFALEEKSGSEVHLPPVTFTDTDK